MSSGEEIGGLFLKIDRQRWKERPVLAGREHLLRDPSNLREVLSLVSRDPDIQ